MKRLQVLSLLAVFALGSISFGFTPNRTLVYKGTIKASKSIFDVNDPTRLFSQTIKAYWAVQVDTEYEIGNVLDSNAVFYDKRNKYYKVVPDCISIDPCDPCNIVMFRFTAADHDGQMGFYAVGRGRILKYSNDSAVVPDYTPKTLKGTGTLLAFDVFDPNITVSGPITVKMTLDSARTRAANPYLLYPGNIINDIVSELEEKEYREWPFDPEIP